MSVVDLLAGCKVITFSNETEENLKQIEHLLLPRKTYCLVGSSGVGKSTLLNRLLGGNQIDTQPVREKDSKGRHTTAHRQLIRHRSGALVIDTPGMRELGNLSVDAGLGDTFVEIAELICLCKFSDCSHTTEMGCAIRAAIAEGTLSEKRYENYEAMKRESAFNEMAYHEKRQKDRAFGKLIKSTQKHKSGR